MIVDIGVVGIVIDDGSVVLIDIADNGVKDIHNGRVILIGVEDDGVETVVVVDRGVVGIDVDNHRVKHQRRVISIVVVDAGIVSVVIDDGSVILVDIPDYGILDMEVCSVINDCRIVDDY